MIVDIKGVGKSQFPDDMDKEQVRQFLTRKYSPPSLQQKINDELTRNKNTVTNVDKSLADKAGQFISDKLYDSGLVSDRYGAQRIGNNLSALGEMLPVVGDIAAGDDFGRAVAKGDALGAGLASLGAIPIVGDVAKKAKDILKSNFPDLNIGISENASSIILDKVIVPERSKGVGTRFMNDLITDADSKGKTIGLTPSSDFGGNKGRLTEFYKRFGFVDNKGKNKDFTISETMIKLPKIINNKFNPSLTDTPGGFKIKTDNGFLEGKNSGSDFMIKVSKVNKQNRGKGEGVELYLNAIEEARKKGFKRVVSDNSTVDQPAIRIYEALERRGIKVDKHPEFKLVKDKSGDFAYAGEEGSAFIINL